MSYAQQTLTRNFRGENTPTSVNVSPRNGCHERQQLTLWFWSSLRSNRWHTFCFGSPGLLGGNMKIRLGIFAVALVAAFCMVWLAVVPAVADEILLEYAGPNFSQFGCDGGCALNDSTSSYLRATFDLNVVPTIGGGTHDYSYDLLNFKISDGQNTITDLGSVPVEDCSHYPSCNDAIGYNVEACQTFPSYFCNDDDGILISLKLNLPNFALNNQNFLFPGASWSFDVITGGFEIVSSPSGDFVGDTRTGGTEYYAGTVNPGDPRSVASVSGSFYSPCDPFAFPNEKPADTIWACSVNRDAGVAGPVNVDDLVLGSDPPQFSTVPEPSSIAVLLAGLSLIGGALYLARERRAIAKV